MRETGYKSRSTNNTYWAFLKSVHSFAYLDQLALLPSAISTFATSSDRGHFAFSEQDGPSLTVHYVVKSSLISCSFLSFSQKSHRGHINRRACQSLSLITPDPPSLPTCFFVPTLKRHSYERQLRIIPHTPSLHSMLPAYVNVVQPLPICMVLQRGTFAKCEHAFPLFSGFFCY